MLFEASSHSGALLAGANHAQEEALKNYGKHLGLAFQLVDDVLDYRGDAETMGKNVGDDLAEGKTTLPLIYAIAHSNDAEKQLIRRAIRKGGIDDLQPVLAIINATGALDYAMAKAKDQALQAKDCLQSLPASEHLDALHLLTDIAVARLS